MKKMMGRNRHITILFGLVCFFGLTRCASVKGGFIAEPEPDAYLLEKLTRADAAYRSAHYFGLKKAYALYRELLDEPAGKKLAVEKFVRAAILLCLREKELGVYSLDTLTPAEELLDKIPGLAEYHQFISSARSVGYKIQGVIRDPVLRYERNPRSVKDYMADVESRWSLLKDKVFVDEFFAFTAMTLNPSPPLKGLSPEDFTRISECFPDSPLIRFKRMLDPAVDTERLKELVQENPDFVTADYYLGEYFLHQGLLLTAEKHFLKVNEKVPESLSTLDYLAGIYLQLEEYTEGLSRYRSVLAAVPEYRKALLGAAQCLGFLGKHEAAIEDLKKLLDLGYYLMGDAHYWAAWNLNELDRLDSAREHIEQAKALFYKHFEVPHLCGLITYKQKKLEEAEENFLESLKIKSDNCEALFYLGKICSERSQWEPSADYFSQAAEGYSGEEAKLHLRIKEVEAAELSPERKARMIRRQKTRLLQTRLIKATSQYNAAAGYINTGKPGTALPFLEKAAEHPSFREPAQKLLAQIKRGSGKC